MRRATLRRSVDATGFSPTVPPSSPSRRPCAGRCGACSRCVLRWIRRERALAQYAISSLSSVALAAKTNFASLEGWRSHESLRVVRRDQECNKLTGYRDRSSRVNRERLLASSRASGIPPPTFRVEALPHRARVRGVPPLGGGSDGTKTSK